MLPSLAALRRRGALALLGAAVLASCGGPGQSGEGAKSPRQIIQDVAGAIRSVHSYHLFGSAGTSGGMTRLDLRVANAQTLSGSLSEKGVTARLVLVGGGLYVQGQDFFRQFGGAQAASIVGDRWVRLPQSEASSLQSAFSAFGNTSTLASCLVSGTRNVSLTKSFPTVGGVQVIELRGDGGVLDVAASGPPYPVRLSGSGSGAFVSSDPACSSGATPGGGGSGAVNFDSWGAGVSVTPPPNPIDLSQVAG